MNKLHEITVVVPAFNEEGSIHQVVTETLSVLARITSRYEVIVVDDGSIDATGEIAERLTAPNEHVRVIHHPENRGLGAALHTGYANARYEFITRLPGDGQIPAVELLKFVPLMDEADVITAYYTNRPHAAWYRTIFSQGLTLLARVFLGRTPRRGGNGMFRKSLLQEIDLQSTTGIVNRELLLKAMKKGYRVCEVAIECRPRLSGRSKVTNLRTIYKTFRELVRLRLKG